MSKVQMKMILFAGLGALALLPGAKADESNQKTVLKFSGPVEMPGQTLPAGTYVFKVASSQSNRHIVQVFSEDEKHVFGTFLAIPNYRHRPSDKTIIRFEERAAGSPQAIKAWFYPGRTTGHEFVYPKAEALALAEANNAPVPAMADAPSIPDPGPAVTMHSPEIMALLMVPVKIEEPSGQEVELAEASEPPAQLPDELPKTATPLPLIGLIGLLSIGTAGTLRLAGAKMK